jgi:hypothetical protein
MSAKKTSRRIAPRLRDGSKREPNGHSMPAPVMEWAKMQAAQRGMSFSYWQEELIIAEYRRTSQERARIAASLYRDPSKRNGRG